jgi:hypothetical protein
MAILNITVPNLPTVLDSYNQLKIYKSATETGTFVAIVTLTLNTQDSFYSYDDVSGLTTDWYKTSYFNSTSSSESVLSAATLAVTAATTQLTANMEILLSLSGSIKSITGKSLAPTEYSFFTSANPSYTSVRSVRLAYGAYLKDIPDYTVYLAIYEASVMADSLSLGDTSNELYIFARKQWVTCKVAEMLLGNTITNSLQSKRLDNFSVTYNGAYGKDIKDKIDACLHKWEEVLMSGNKANQSLVGVVKGACDVDQKNVGRLWQHGPGIKDPGANTRYRPDNRRRFIHGWRPTNSSGRNRF